MGNIMFIPAFVFTALAQPATTVVPETRVQTILKQARAAIWDETKSQPLRSLSLTASRRLARRANQVKMTLEALFPDKFLQTDIISFGPVGSDAILLQAINGAQAWSALNTQAMSAQDWAGLQSGGASLGGAEKKSAARDQQATTEGTEASPNASEEEMRWMVSDYRSVNGITLPHHLIRSTGNQLMEEIELQKIKVNTSFKPDRFENKQEKKK